ncbi:MAG: orotidine-5'-phosphate decarboxylase [archaeon]
MKIEWNEFLKKSAEENRNIVCMGIDPVIEKIEKVAKGKNIEERLFNFYSEIIEEAKKEGVLPATVKPNYAFFAQYGFEGMKALKKLIEKFKEEGVPVIFDGKRADIGKSSAAYARELFDFWEADSITVNPFMGSDSVEPFIKYCEEKGKGVHLLNRTSNPGAKDFQNLMVEGKPLYLKVSEKVIEWSENAKGNLGVVIGATSLDELKEIAKFFVDSGKEIPLLIPGVGAQGGSAREVTEALKKNNYDLSLVRINSSSGINYAFEKKDSKDFSGEAVKALKELIKEINY